jgi:uncharacterized membrane protein YccC
MRFHAVMNEMDKTAATEPVRGWRERLAETWPDALRLLAGAMLAYLVARLLGLHEAHWAVLTALITARGHAGGTARAGVERLIATVAGAGLAIAASWLRHAGHVDGGVILFLALAPLCLLVALKPNYRGAPIAALIVLSAGPAAGMGPLDTALLRTGEIAIGAVAAMFVSAFVFPSRSKAKPRAHAAAVLRPLAQWLRLASSAEGKDGVSVERLREDIRHELRELTILAHTSGWKKMQDKELERLLKLVSGLSADVGFLVRAVARRPLAQVVDALRGPVGDAVQSLIAAIERSAAALAQGVPVAERGDIDARLKTLASAAREAPPQIEARHVYTLIYLLHTVANDLDALSATLSPAANVAAERKE